MSIVIAKNKRKLTIKKLRKENVEPKKPLTPYLSYLKTLDRSQFKGQSLGKMQEFVKNAGQSWKELSDEEKKPFVDEYDKAKKQYNEEMNIWAAKMAEEGKSDIVPLRFRSEDASEPKKTTKITKKKAKKPAQEEDEGETKGMAPEEVKEAHQNETNA